MNSLVLAVVLCCAVAATQAQDLPAWLPPMQPYSCLWCSGRYYRRSPQALTTGRAAVGSASAPTSDLALHAGFFYDIIPKYSVKNEKSACIYLVNMYRKDKGPVAATEIMSYINMSFFGPQQTKDYSDKPHPLTFQCCHYKFGRQLMDKLNTVEDDQDVVVSTTSVPDDSVTTVVTTAADDVVSTTDRPRLTGRSGKTHKKNKKTVTVRDGGEDDEQVQQQRRKRYSGDDDSTDTTVVNNKKTTLKNRNSLRVPQKVDSAVVVVDDTNTTDDVVADKYMARMPDILPEGFTCDTLTRQLYMELSQDNESRQKQIQKAMQRNVRTARGVKAPRQHRPPQA